MTVQSHRDLLVWQRSMALVVECYRATAKFPRSETYGLTSQLQRAAVSVPANIAEGKGRSSIAAYLNHLDIASGSLAELDAHLMIAFQLEYLDADSHQRLTGHCDEVGRMLTGLRKSLEAKRTSRRPNT